MWRKFEADDQDQYPEGTDMTGVPQPRGVTPPPRFTRTSYKPRTLFPEAHKKGDTTDEEAITDIEHPEKHGIDKSIAKLAGTPTKKRFYATPPTTARTTRSTAKRPVGGGDTTSEPDKLSTSLFTVIKGKRTSPFNEWARMKGEGGPTPGEKKKRKSDQTLTRKEAKRVKSDISD